MLVVFNIIKRCLVSFYIFIYAQIKKDQIYTKNRAWIPNKKKQQQTPNSNRYGKTKFKNVKFNLKKKKHKGRSQKHKINFNNEPVGG